MPVSNKTQAKPSSNSVNSKSKCGALFYELIIEDMKWYKIK